MDLAEESRRRRIDPAAKAAFLAGLRDGLAREDSAAAAGFSLTGFYGERRRDPKFATDWAAALALPPAAERRACAYAERGEVRIAPANRRLLQRRRRRHVRFTAERRALYVTRLAETCDSAAAAEAAGIHPSTARLHRHRDPVFDSACREALGRGLPLLEAEAVRQRLAEQARLRAALDRAGPADRPALLAEQGAEFDRTMKLLARHDRAERRPDSRFKPGGRRQSATFDDAIVELDRKLRAFGVRRGILPPREEGEGEGEDGPQGERPGT